MPHLTLKQTTGPLPTSEYELYEDNILIGKIQIRHKPSHAPEIPENMESHIYYEIIPVHRNKGYGKTILKLGIEKAKELGLREIFITCMENNTSSKKIIESNGGTLIDQAYISHENANMLKYAVHLQK